MFKKCLETGSSKNIIPLNKIICKGVCEVIFYPFILSDTEMEEGGCWDMVNTTEGHTACDGFIRSWVLKYTWRRCTSKPSMEIYISTTGLMQIPGPSLRLKFIRTVFGARGFCIFNKYCRDQSLRNIERQLKEKKERETTVTVFMNLITVKQYLPC